MEMRSVKMTAVGTNCSMCFESGVAETNASVDTSRDGARAEERESTGSARTGKVRMERSATRMARMVHESTRMQSADDAGEIGG